MEATVGFRTAAAAYVRDMGGWGGPQDNGQGVTGATLSRRLIFQKRNSYKADEEEDEDDVADSDRSSSSIGIPEDSDDDDGEEVLSKVATEGFGSLGSLASMEDLLPIKRGLSNHFSGKSKSFTSLAEAVITMKTAKELEKTEHPFNKKRRILRWSKNLMMLPTVVSMPLLPVSEEDESRRRDQDDPDDNERDRGSHMKKELPTPQSVFKSYSCFALTDLREEVEEEEEDEDD